MVDVQHSRAKRKLHRSVFHENFEWIFSTVAFIVHRVLDLLHSDTTMFLIPLEMSISDQRNNSKMAPLSAATDTPINRTNEWFAFRTSLISEDTGSWLLSRRYQNKIDSITFFSFAEQRLKFRDFKHRQPRKIFKYREKLKEKLNAENFSEKKNISVE